MDRITIENGEERDVDEATDYLCEECSTDELAVYHEEVQ